MKSNVENRTAVCGLSLSVVLGLLLFSCSSAAIGGVFSAPVNFDPATATGAAVLENNSGQYVVAANIGGELCNQQRRDHCLERARRSHRWPRPH